MRISLARYALVPLVTLVLVGCQSSQSSVKMPKFSMSKLNPFSKGSDDATYPPKPSGLAAPSVTSPSGAGYADAASPAPGQSGYTNVAPGYSPAANPYARSSYPSASTSSLAGAAASTNPATTPQSGYYDTGSGYGLAERSGSTPSYQVPAGAGAPSSGYSGAGTTGQYGTAAAPRYGVVADRYGLNRGPSQPSTDPGTSQGSATPYPGIPRYNPQAPSSQSAGSRYESATSPDNSRVSDSRYTGDSTASGLSVADSRRDSVPSYGSESRSLVGGRYASQDAQAAGFSSDNNGQFRNSSGDASWDPGRTGYAPGQSDYEPGDTGYQPSGIPRYRSPAGSYSTAPFLPGSTKTYAPRTPSGSATPDESLSQPQVQPTTDSQVIPAGHIPPSSTRMF